MLESNTWDAKSPFSSVENEYSAGSQKTDENLKSAVFFYSKENFSKTNRIILHIAFKVRKVYKKQYINEWDWTCWWYIIFKHQIPMIISTWYTFYDEMKKAIKISIWRAMNIFLNNMLINHGKRMIGQSSTKESSLLMYAHAFVYLSYSFCY